MNISLISLTENGRKISEKIAAYKTENIIFKRYTFQKFSDKNSVSFSSLKDLTGELFRNSDALVFICSCGIAVRMTAPHVKSKSTDPAVVAVDEQGKFAVSLLSGHLGGANAVAEKISEIIGCTPVITTASDIGGKFSPDSFAKANGLYFDDFETAKKIASKTVNGEKIGFCSDYKYINRPDEFFDEEIKDIGICISKDIKKNPFDRTLMLIPTNVVIGVGCKRNTDIRMFDDFLNRMLERFCIPIQRICEIHTIDIKRDEKAVAEFSDRYNIPLKFYSAKELMNVPGKFSASEFVLKTTGADNICERSAAADGGKITVHKQSENGMTFAAAEKEIILDFERKIL